MIIREASVKEGSVFFSILFIIFKDYSIIIFKNVRRRVDGAIMQMTSL